MKLHTHPSGRTKKRGSILFLTLLFMVLINLFAVAFWKLVPVEMNSAKRHQLETEAYFASDAGVTDAIAFLEAKTAAGNIDNYLAGNGVVDSEGNTILTRTGTINGWKWDAKIIPGPETYGNKDFVSPNPIRVFKVEAVAKRDGFSTDSQQYRKVSTWIKQKSFAKDGWGVNGAATNSNPLWLNMSTFKLGGTYRTNDKALVDVSNNSFWSNSSAAIGGELLFAVNSTNTSLNQVVDGVEYKSFSSQTNLPYNKDTGSAISGRYEKIVSGGRNAVRKVDVAVLPASTDSVAFGVWGGTPPTSTLNKSSSVFGNSGGANVRINGASPGGAAINGIYVEGDVNQIDFSLLNGNQSTKIYQGGGSNQYVEMINVTDGNYTIPSGATVSGVSPGTTLRPTDNGGKGWTVLKDGASTNKYVVYQEQTNGAIYATGNVDGVRGVVHGRRTVATQTDSGSGQGKDRRIYINGDLTYKSTTPGQTPTSTDDMLGLISYAVRMQDAQASSAPTSSNPQLGKMWPKRSNTNTNNPLFLYTSIFAGRENDPRKSWSTASEDAGGFGSESPGNSSLGAGFMKLYGSINEGVRLWKGSYGSDGNGVSGYSYAFELDPGLEQVQPPFFPTLPKYDIITWEEQSVFSY